MYKRKFLGIALALSLLANAAIFVFGLRAVYVRGGITYLKSHWDGTPLASSDSIVHRSLFEVLPRRGSGPTIVFLGDSLTDFCEWSELLGVPVINRGISGDTTADVLSRLDTVLTVHPSSVFLMVGINDAVKGVSVESAAQNYRQIIQHIRASSPNTIIYAESVLPVYSPMANLRVGRGRGPGINEWVRAMNQQISSLAENKSVFFVDLRDDLAQGEELNPRYSADGVHLNGAGYEVWKHKISPFLIAHDLPPEIERK